MIPLGHKFRGLGAILSGLVAAAILLAVGRGHVVLGAVASHVAEYLFNR